MSSSIANIRHRRKNAKKIVDQCHSIIKNIRKKQQEFRYYNDNNEDRMKVVATNEVRDVENIDDTVLTIGDIYDCNDKAEKKKDNEEHEYFIMLSKLKLNRVSTNEILKAKGYQIVTRKVPEALVEKPPANTDPTPIHLLKLSKVAKQASDKARSKALDKKYENTMPELKRRAKNECPPPPPSPPPPPRPSVQSNRRTVEELTIDAKKKVKRRQSILIVNHAKKFNESKRAKLQRRKRNRQVFHQLQHTVKNKERLKTGTHRRFSTLNFRKELEQSSIGLEMFKEQKSKFMKQRKYSLLNCIHVANERLQRKNKVSQKRVTFKELKLDEGIKDKVKEMERKKILKREKYANKMLNEMEMEKKLLHDEKMERIRKTHSILHEARKILGKKQIDVAFTDGAISVESNEKIVNMGFTDGCVGNLTHTSSANGNGQRKINLYFTDGTLNVGNNS